MEEIFRKGGGWADKAKETCIALVMGLTMSLPMVSGVNACVIEDNPKILKSSYDVAPVVSNFNDSNQYSVNGESNHIIEKIKKDLERRSLLNSPENLPGAKSFLAENVQMDFFADQLYQNINQYVSTFMNAKNGDIINMNGENILFITNEGLNNETEIRELISGLDEEKLKTLGFEDKESLLSSITAGLGNAGFRSAFLDTGRELKVITLSVEDGQNLLDRGYRGNMKEALASVVAHELGHYVYEGNNGHENEFFSDLLAIKYSIDNGTDPVQAVENFKNLRKNSDGAVSYHTNTFEYLVLENLLEQNPNAFDYLTVSDLNSISAMASNAGLDLVRNQLRPRMYDDLIDLYTVQKPIEMENIGEKVSEIFFFYHIGEGGLLEDIDINSDDFIKHLEDSGLKDKYRDDFDFITKKIKKDFTDSNGNIDKVALDYFKSNNFLSDLLKDRDNIDSYTRDRFNRALANELLNTPGDFSQKLEKLAIDVSQEMNYGITWDDTPEKENKKRKTKENTLNLTQGGANDNR